LDSVKKFSDLIRAAALLKERVPGLRLLIVGDGPDRGALEELAASLGVAVVFTGYQGHTAPYFACMDLFALASQTEAFGIVLIEAMFFRLPVVATAVGGIPDVVLKDRTGLLVEKNAPGQLASAIEQLYLDPSRRKSLGDAGFERAMENFTIGVYVDRIEALYLEAAGRRGVHL
jgi:L-malate glycosyltransferase